MKIRSPDPFWRPWVLWPAQKGGVYSAVIFLIIYALMYLILSVEDHFKARMLLWHRSVSALLGAAFLMIAGSAAAAVALRFVDRYLIRPQAQKLQEENIKFRHLAVAQDRLKAVSTLAAGMAHEIKNPLTSIRTFAEYLPKNYDDPHFRERFSKIVVDEVDRVNNIVNQLLEFSRPQAPDLKIHAVDLLLDETLNLLTHNLLQDKITVEKNYTAGLNLLGDKNQLKQVFLNIFLNSLQAMHDGGRLTIDTRRLESASKDAALVVRICDTGCGIAKQQLRDVFNPFFTTKENGTGLGLSIVHGILSKHGGTVEIESELGKGTCVSVTLRCAG